MASSFLVLIFNLKLLLNETSLHEQRKKFVRLEFSHPKATRLRIAKSVIQEWCLFAFIARDFNMEFLHIVFQNLFVTCEVSANCILEKWQLLMHHLYLYKTKARERLKQHIYC